MKQLGTQPNGNKEIKIETFKDKLQTTYLEIKEKKRKQLETQPTKHDKNKQKLRERVRDIANET